MIPGIYTDSDQAMLSLKALLSLRVVLLVSLMGTLGVLQGTGWVSLPIPSLLWQGVMFAALSLVSWVRLKTGKGLGSKELLAQLIADWAFLTLLLYQTGGGSNPFVMLYIPLLALGSLILPARQSILLGVLCVLSYGVLTREYVPLVLKDPSLGTTLHLIGMWLNFAITAGVLVSLTARLTHKLREKEQRLSALKAQVRQEQTMASLGRWSAATLHELGGPVSTLNLLTEGWDRLEGTTSISSDEATDIKHSLLKINHSINLMKQRLSHSETGDGPAEENRVNLQTLLQDTLEDWRNLYPNVQFKIVLPDTVQAHGLNSATFTRADWDIVETLLALLLQNALQATEHVQGHQVLGDHSQIELACSLKATTPPGKALMQSHLLASVSISNLCLKVPDDRFGQLGLQALESQQGRGVGLLIAKELAQSLSGTLEFEQRAADLAVDTGTPFYRFSACFEWPLKRVVA